MKAVKIIIASVSIFGVIFQAPLGGRHISDLADVMPFLWVFFFFFFFFFFFSLAICHKMNVFTHPMYLKFHHS